MSATTTAIPGQGGPEQGAPGREGGAAWLAWAAADSWTMTRRELAH
ncbi:ABC transporter permease, partial [Streptomyces sp. SID8455]|nr:ABC transporter permease [Streptomyces sp. SID8455]